jgi:hypothetical protein
MTHPTATERLALARRHAQDAADSARAACALLAMRGNAARWTVLRLDLEEWACAQTARLSALQARLKELEARAP